jgi:hypothetical protein
MLETVNCEETGVSGGNEGIMLLFMLGKSSPNHLNREDL